MENNDVVSHKEAAQPVTESAINHLWFCGGMGRLFTHFPYLEAYLDVKNTNMINILI